MLRLFISISEQERTLNKQVINPPSTKLHLFTVLGAYSSTSLPASSTLLLVFFPSPGKPLCLSPIYLDYFSPSNPIQMPTLQYSNLRSLLGSLNEIIKVSNLVFGIIVSYSLVLSSQKVCKFTVGTEHGPNFVISTLTSLLYI